MKRLIKAPDADKHSQDVRIQIQGSDVEAWFHMTPDEIDGWVDATSPAEVMKILAKGLLYLANKKA